MQEVRGAGTSSRKITKKIDYGEGGKQKASQVSQIRAHSQADRFLAKRLVQKPDGASCNKYFGIVRLDSHRFKLFDIFQFEFTYQRSGSHQGSLNACRMLDRDKEFQHFSCKSIGRENLFLPRVLSESKNGD